jgi:hypothetical protein
LRSRTWHSARTWVPPLRRSSSSRRIVDRSREIPPSYFCPAFSYYSCRCDTFPIQA